MYKIKHKHTNHTSIYTMIKMEPIIIIITLRVIKTLGTLSNAKFYNTYYFCYLASTCFGTIAIRRQLPLKCHENTQQ